ncbi:AAA family ATPase [Thermoproteus tenax]|uniref:Predicted ATPase n=1 Tax=Thermoproteus tenax (strain ATCC 35583 / DSM 2078 / JCM 9277 / NBRC 100435 / Kra 1) TaxID=768679 RepID=G4RNA1_THETK|nr:AAA family ATPase [Thermoproteus tenax]CCC81045.1 predicted ATPase [Thermoproteus tenax Kra 1]
MRVAIRDFKSVAYAELEIAPLTVLIGPPAGGKSNILDALAVLGYPARLLRLNEEYGGRANSLEPLEWIARFTEPRALFRNYDLTKTPTIEMPKYSVSIHYRQGLRLQVKAGDATAEIDMKYLTAGGDLASFQDILVETRLYGYDRYGLSATGCRQGHCGFYDYLTTQGRVIPHNILSDLGWNIRRVIRYTPDVVREINETLAERLGEKIELKVSKEGAIAVYDYDYEVTSPSVSEDLYRLVYYLAALRSAASYAKLYGLEGRLVVALEEPEAHLFPFLLDLLADHIAQAASTIHVVLAAHNPLLLSALWDRVAGVKTYYIHRDKHGATTAEIDIRKMAQDLATAEDVMLTSAAEILAKYAKSPATPNATPTAA